MVAAPAAPAAKSLNSTRCPQRQAAACTQTDLSARGVRTLAAKGRPCGICRRGERWPMPIGAGTPSYSCTMSVLHSMAHGPAGRWVDWSCPSGHVPAGQASTQCAGLACGRTEDQVNQYRPANRGTGECCSCRVGDVESEAEGRPGQFLWRNDEVRA